MKPSSRGVLLCVTFAIILLPVPSRAQPLPLRSIVELALSHASGAAIAAADEQRAAAAYREVRDNYIPQITFGAGLGPPSYGFPLSLEGQPPSLFNINAQSSLWNPSLRQFLKAAKVDTTVATLRTKDQRNQIIQDAAQSYAELAKWEQRLQRLRQTEEDENKMVAAVAERVKEGVDSEIEGTKARLSLARVRLRIAEAQGAARHEADHATHELAQLCSSISRAIAPPAMVDRSHPAGVCAGAVRRASASHATLIFQ